MKLVLKTGLQQNRKAIEELARLAVTWGDASPDVRFVGNKLQGALKDIDRALERLERPSGVTGTVTGRFVGSQPEEQPRPSRGQRAYRQAANAAVGCKHCPACFAISHNATRVCSSCSFEFYDKLENSDLVQPLQRDAGGLFPYQREMVNADFTGLEQRLVAMTGAKKAKARRLAELYGKAPEAPMLDQDAFDAKRRDWEAKEEKEYNRQKEEMAKKFEGPAPSSPSKRSADYGKGKQDE